MVFPTVGDHVLRLVLVTFALFLSSLFKNVLCVNAITTRSSSTELARILGHDIANTEDKLHADNKSGELERIPGYSLGGNKI